MGAYASRCNWCGRSSSVSTIFQLLTLAGMIVAALIVGGVMPLSTLSVVLPDSWFDETPVLPQATESATGSDAPAPNGGTGGTRGGYGAPGVGGSGESDPGPRRRADGPADRRGVVIGPASDSTACASPAAVSALALRFASWSRADVELVACRRIRTGFTPDQVIAALGRPQRRIDSGDGSGTVVWVYRDRRVVIERGQVVVTGAP